MSKTRLQLSVYSGQLQRCLALCTKLVLQKDADYKQVQTKHTKLLEQLHSISQNIASWCNIQAKALHDLRSYDQPTTCHKEDPNINQLSYGLGSAKALNAIYHRLVVALDGNLAHQHEFQTQQICRQLTLYSKININTEYQPTRLETAVVRACQSTAREWAAFAQGWDPSQGHRLIAETSLMHWLDQLGIDYKSFVINSR